MNHLIKRLRQVADDIYQEQSTITAEELIELLTDAADELDRQTYRITDMNWTLSPDRMGS